MNPLAYTMHEFSHSLPSFLLLGLRKFDAKALMQSLHKDKRNRGSSALTLLRTGWLKAPLPPILPAVLPLNSIIQGMNT